MGVSKKDIQHYINYLQRDTGEQGLKDQSIEDKTPEKKDMDNNIKAIMDKNPDIDDNQKGKDVDNDIGDKNHNQKDKDVDKDVADKNHSGNHNRKDKDVEDKDADPKGNAKDTTNEHKAEDVESEDSDSSSSSSSGKSDRPLPVVDTSNWNSDWHDTWEHALTLSSQVDSAHKRRQGPRTNIGNQQIEWAEIETRRTDGPLHGWSAGLVKECLRGHLSGIVYAKTMNDFYLTLQDLAAWFLDDVVVELLGDQRSKTIVFLGLAENGKTPAAQAIAMAVSEYYILRDNKHDSIRMRKEIKPLLPFSGRACPAFIAEEQGAFSVQYDYQLLLSRDEDGDRDGDKDENEAAEDKVRSPEALSNASAKQFEKEVLAEWKGEQRWIRFFNLVVEQLREQEIAADVKEPPEDVAKVWVLVL
ncbi:unnamed protein product [Symbiodinium microadriaticum]|nr:unnamed protein product [Symbiodinium microadriaticum]CAE7947714.1 unnamed protein product [Symbiodinium sp. KB8]